MTPLKEINLSTTSFKKNRPEVNLEENYLFFILMQASTIEDL